MSAPAGVAAPSGRARSQSARGAGLLGLAGLVTALAGFITGPLLAHSLGAEGRGVVASVLVPLGLAPVLLQIGTGLYVARAVAGGETSVEKLLGSVWVPLALIASPLLLFGPDLANALIPEDATAAQILGVGLQCAPISLAVNVLVDAAWGRQQFGVMTLVRVLPPVGQVASFSLLAAIGELTAASACIAALVTSLPPLFVGLGAARPGRPRFDFAVTRSAFSFGLRAWPGTMASLANQRLDQLLMIPLLEPRELGLYVVAVTVSTIAAGLIVEPVTSAIFPRIAAGERHLLGRLVRSSMLLVGGVHVVLAVAVPWLVPLMFGSEFRDAIPLIWVLLVAGVTQVGRTAIGLSLAALGWPQIPTYAELASLVVTAIGLLVLLPTQGAMGAAWTSLAAYLTAATVLVIAADRRLGVGPVELLRPRREDVTVVQSAIVTLYRRGAARVPRRGRGR